MAKQKIIEYITEQRRSGYSDKDIRSALLARGGWSQIEVDDAFRAIGFVPIDRKESWIRKHRRFIETLAALIVLGLLLVYVIMAGIPLNYKQPSTTSLAGSQGAPGEVNPSYNYCGDDEICFQGYATLCSPAKAAITQNFQTGSAFYIQTIEGLQNGKCKMEIYYVTHPDSQAVGKKMTCLIPSGSYGNYKDWLLGNRLDGCTGDLIGIIY